MHPHACNRAASDQGCRMQRASSVPPTYIAHALHNTTTECEQAHIEKRCHCLYMNRPAIHAPG